MDDVERLERDALQAQTDSQVAALRAELAVERARRARAEAGPLKIQIRVRKEGSPSNAALRDYFEGRVNDRLEVREIMQANWKHYAHHEAAIKGTASNLDRNGLYEKMAQCAKYWANPLNGQTYQVYKSAYHADVRRKRRDGLRNRHKFYWITPSPKPTGRVEEVPE